MVTFDTNHQTGDICHVATVEYDANDERWLRYLPKTLNYAVTTGAWKDMQHTNAAILHYLSSILDQVYVAKPQVVDGPEEQWGENPEWEEED